MCRLTRSRFEACCTPRVVAWRSLQAPDRRHYVVTAGDRLRDGVVEAVVSDGVLLVADADRFDSAGARRQIRKGLRERPERR